MEKLIAPAFYVVLGLVAIGATWLIDSSQGQPAVTPTEVKSQVINLKASDFNESKNLKDAVNRLSKPVQKPTSQGILDTLQPAVKNQDTPKLPQ